MKVCVVPEAHVLVARWVLAVGLERCNLSVLELGDETRILGPKEANVRDIEEHHRQTFKAEAKRPAHLLTQSSVANNLLLQHTAPKHLKPVTLQKQQLVSIAIVLERNLRCSAR